MHWWCIIFKKFNLFLSVKYLPHYHLTQADCWLNNLLLDVRMFFRIFDILLQYLNLKGPIYTGLWRSGVGIAICRSWVHFPLGQSCVTTLGNLSPSSITWNRSKDGDVLRLRGWRQTWRKVMAACRRGRLKKSPAGWISVHRDQLRAQRSVTNMDNFHLYLYMSVICSIVCR